MQCMVIEYARAVMNMPGANSTEMDPKAEHNIIDLMEEQKHITNMGASMRLGAYDCVLKKGSLAYKAYGKSKVSERHRHRYELNNEYKNQLEVAGMKCTGVNPPDTGLVEVVEVPALRGTLVRSSILSIIVLLSRPTRCSSALCRPRRHTGTKRRNKPLIKERFIVATTRQLHKKMDKNTVIGLLLITGIIIAFSIYNRPSREQLENKGACEIPLPWWRHSVPDLRQKKISRNRLRLLFPGPGQQRWRLFQRCLSHIISSTRFD